MMTNRDDGYRYTECGLDNVVIRGMEPIVDDAGDYVIEIRNVNGLHRTIAFGIVRHHASISPKELRFLRTEIGLTQAELARNVHVDGQTVGRWERGETPIDPNAEALIRLLAVEKLELDKFSSIEDVARRCVPTATVSRIVIDVQTPGNYILSAAA